MLLLFLFLSASFSSVTSLDVEAEAYWPPSHPNGDGKLKAMHAQAEASPAWEYERDNEYGPARWNLINSACAGSFQSPIDIETDSVVYDPSLKPLSFDYQSWANHTVVQTGHALQANEDKGVRTSILSGGALNGRQYSVAQFHLHALSEHTVNGATHPLEIHIVHVNLNSSEGVQTSPYELSVVGLMFKEGAFNAALEPFVAAVNTGTFNQLNSFATADIDLLQLLPEDKTYFTYPGSLTTPNCRETVTWHVLRQVQEVSGEQLSILRRASAVQYNNRPVQEINSRQVRTNYEAPVPPTPAPVTTTPSAGTQNVVNINFASLFSGLQH